MGVQKLWHVFQRSAAELRPSSVELPAIIGGTPSPSLSYNDSGHVVHTRATYRQAV